jgi:hypothetical protein
LREERRLREVIVQEILDREEHAWTDLLFEGWLADLVEQSLAGVRRVFLFLKDNSYEIRKTVVYYGGKFYDIGVYAHEVVAKNDEIVAKVPDISRVPGMPADAQRACVEADHEFDRMIREVAGRIVEELKTGRMIEWDDAWILEESKDCWPPNSRHPPPVVWLDVASCRRV